MKAFVLAIGVMVVVALGAGFALDGVFATSADQAFTSNNVRLN